jgi:hypothetical protein
MTVMEVAVNGRTILTCALPLCTLLVAGVPGDCSAGAEVATARGSKAIVFSLNGLSDLSLSRYAGGIGMRFYLRDRLALRPGMLWSWSWYQQHPNPVPPGQEMPGDSRQIDTAIGLNAVLEKHLKGTRSVSPYLGAGLEGIYHNNKTEPGLPPTVPEGTLTKITDRGWTAGVLGVLGFEWGWTESITLGGEYRFSFRASANTREQEFRGLPDQQTDDRALFQSDFSTSALFLSINL